jgi:hypothetical protein
MASIAATTTRDTHAADAAAAKHIDNANCKRLHSRPSPCVRDDGARGARDTFATRDPTRSNAIPSFPWCR